jgi:superoxide dismutase, Cu-Zn family
MSGMVSAPPLVVRSLSLFLIPVIALGCASHRRASAPPASPSANAPPPSSAEPSTHTMHGDGAPAPSGEALLGTAIDPGATNSAPVREAVAVLAPLKGSRVTGVVRFRVDGDALDVTTSVDGLPGGVHAYHVHVYGDCSSPDGESAGPHFHFTGSSFGEARIITGNLGELRPGGKPTIADRTRIQASLGGRYSILGRAVIVHERGNDPTSPPDGAAGKRLACGVIGIAGPAPAAPRAALRKIHM